MSDQQDDAYWRETLLALREALIGTAAERAAAGEVVELDQTRVGRLSRMDALQGQAMAQASHARAAVRLKLIDAALRRLDAGVFGLCTHCEEAIDPRRLAAEPTALRCIGCAQSAD